MAAEAGDSTAQRLLALAYSNASCGLCKNDAEAVRWMTRAAEREDCDAMYWLNVCYSRGVGVAKDLNKALFWAQRAADMGHPEAQYSLGSIHLTGEGVTQCLEQAAFWFRRAGLNGNAAAQCNLGALYAQGLGGLQQNYVEALNWYQLSAEKGNPDGQHNLALMYSQGLGGLQQDLDLARSWCEKAAEQGQSKAIAMLQTLPPSLISEDDASRTSAGSAGRGISETAANHASSASAEEDALAAKLGEVQDLLAEIRDDNASVVSAKELLDRLLERAGTLHNTLAARPWRKAAAKSAGCHSPASPQHSTSSTASPTRSRSMVTSIAADEQAEREVQDASGARLSHGSPKGCFEAERRGHDGKDSWNAVQ